MICMVGTAIIKGVVAGVRQGEGRSRHLAKNGRARGGVDDAALHCGADLVAAEHRHVQRRAMQTTKINGPIENKKNQTTRKTRV